MFYVVLETSTKHQAENPKDQTQITNFYYQFIDTKILRTINESTESKLLLLQRELLNKSKSIPVNYDIPNGLQIAVDKLHQIINEALNFSDFIICSMFSTWTLKVILQRQAFDENVNLPKFLKHLKIFDLWKEYGVWYNRLYSNDTTALNTVNKKDMQSLFDSRGDPDDIRLTSCLTLLDLTELYPGIETQTNQHEENGAADDQPKVLLQSLKNINTTITVLATLFAKRNNDETESYDIFSHPYNLELDFKTFQEEESNILYMTNLPIDITQSELESWFTQHGTRPIGFWTFKNILETLFNLNNNNNNNNQNLTIWKYNQFSYIEELNSIPGFVVFQNHENAKDALYSLNGRSILSNATNTKQPQIVEHIIELQPSSTKVIDLAKEILISFPQSKNKPRPGDWNCPSCGFLNFQRRIACYRCSLPIPSTLQKTKSETSIRTHINNNSNDFNDTTIRYGSVNPTANYHNNTLIPTYNENQKLSTLHNLPIYNNNFTNSINDRNSTTTTTTTTINYNPKVTYVNTPYHGNPNTYSGIPFRAGDWKCVICDYHNFAKNIVCLRCGEPKKTTTYSKSPIKKTKQNKSNENSNNDFINSNSEINTPRMDIDNKRRT